ncbi:MULTISPECIES: type-F conjugative transfer system pilin assembly protein TrbC [Serratia]|uniref:Type-F conjugative transfer system pilin assembly protein TrbC n=1 Tax=Serratia marcescens TaxID=615 RepID=A0ABD5BTC6_SERMA|nr:type-F conjugative transfer system pilin assembly protein TrbC [Serratia marcescens]MDQ9388586.1 type-F conjugative transfer system pilin assembly protein TrbC [Serratia marcescens]MDQ9405159.1 type-F conjugative transfer system pilin assembly protein TrbC [Serratia marcescens]MDQ9439887.1 type-F conjugative transfer system pilin assembly protein TrbC [Serratia marcescens]MDQ9474283.1 type-F conjugative transfer system pilin assembly protein TrbC [Serratia marcescens]MDQ9542390.1 type-F con
MTTYSKATGLLTVLLTAATVPMIAVGKKAADPVATAQQQAAVQVDSNRAWLREQEKRSADLHQNTPVPEFLRNQPPRSLAQDDQSFIDQLAAKQRQDAAEQPAEGALYFVSFAIPEEGMRRMLQEARRFGIPATLRGMVNGDMRETVQRVQKLVEAGGIDGVQIDPQPYSQFGITAVPALVVRCAAGFDVVSGNLLMAQALKKVAKDGDCAATAQALLDKESGK